MKAASIAAWLDRGVRAVDTLDEIERDGLVSYGLQAWRSMSVADRERLTGNVCELCGEARSVCECCAECGFTPCACEARFGAILEVKGEAIG